MVQMKDVCLTDLLPGGSVLGGFDFYLGKLISSDSHLGLSGNRFLVAVSSFRESKSNVRRFYVSAEAKTLHLRARSSGDRAAWLRALAFSPGGLLPSRLINSRFSLAPSDSCVLTKSLKERLVRAGVREDVVRDCERIMLSVFSQVQWRLRLLCQERSSLLDALRQLVTYNTEAEAAVIHGNGHILMKHDFTVLVLEKYCGGLLPAVLPSHLSLAHDPLVSLDFKYRSDTIIHQDESSSF
ncbi:hypothetical protein MLD38_019673 [Melastoma candidum]|uniref:Uncharacterized protein n=1 Tax=Melastoma candidum TaxID=119954 RepID=A0ACB9R616_9MYRT|nr:hypothetical protein MLD38_019673 [Melastoma candidum]